MPLVSVIIPTPNRARYAVPTIRSVLAASPDIEVVVCDTSEVDLISSEFKNDLRLRLIRPNRVINVVDNFNEALSAATGDYLVFIGDDDFVSSKIFDVAKWATKEQVDSVKFTFPVNYYWPDYIHRTRGADYSGCIYITPFSGNVTQHDSKKALAEALNAFGGGVFEMPRAYAGMISRKLAEKICTRYGSLFGGISPDIYSSVLISLESERSVKVDFPVIIPGAAGGSGSGLSASGKHVGLLRESPYIATFKNLKWDYRIPEFYSVPTVWSYSLLKAVEAAGIDLKKVNFPRLYAKCLIYQRPFTKYTLISLRYHIKNNGIYHSLIGILTGCAAEALWVFGKILDRIKGRINPAKTHIIKGVQDTFAANKALDNCINLKQLKLSLNLNSK